MEPERAGGVRYGVWGLILGAAIAIVTGFAWGGWRTGGTSERVTEEALLATRAAICVAQFIKDPSYKENLNQLEETNSWERAALIEKGGWDKMPGEEKASTFTVSRACADGLALLVEK